MKTCLTWMLVALFAVGCHPFESTDLSFDEDQYCREGQVTCDARCTNLQTSQRNCGECGVECPQGLVCVAGECGVLTCTQDETACNTRCVDLRTDARHCGSCGNVCEDGAECLGGLCLCDGDPCDGCPPGQEACDGVCVDLNSDVSHCGGCNSVCDASLGERCEAGMCCAGPDCACDGQLCGEQCLSAEELLDSTEHCGTCFNPCPDGESCVGGSCQGPAPVAIAAGDRHTCALYDDGKIKCWGDNSVGQLNGSPGTTHGPFEVPVPSGFVFTSVVAGLYHTCGLTELGHAVCWGDNSAMQISADGDAVVLPTLIRSDGNILTISSIAPGFDHTCYVHEDAVECRGQSMDGALGPDTNPGIAGTRFDLLMNVKALEVISGSEYSCALGADLGVYCWGHLLPIVDGEQLSPWGLGWVSLAAGQRHICGSTDLQGARGTYCAGQNSAGQLNGIPSMPSLDQQVSDTPAELLTAGEGFSCASSVGATKIECWGEIPDNGPDRGPRDLVVGLPVAGIAAGGRHLCALVVNDGGRAIRCIGENEDGQVSPGDHDVNPFFMSFVDPVTRPDFP